MRTVKRTAKAAAAAPCAGCDWAGIDWRARTDIDWLAAAIGFIARPGSKETGHVQRAAKKLGVTETTLYRWLDRGLGDVPTWRTMRLSELSGIPLEVLATRRGPFAMKRQAPARCVQAAAGSGQLGKQPKKGVA